MPNTHHWPPQISFLSFPALFFYEPILAPLPSSSWMHGANGRDLEEVRGRKWSEVRESAPPASSPSDREHGSGYILLPSAPLLFNSDSSERTPGALCLLSLFGSLNPSHPQNPLSYPSVSYQG